jgi:light-regulated signal transduction histidine kinase (bacteriophytochrome)
MDSIRRQTNKMEIIETRLMGQSALSQIRHAFFAPVATVSLVFLSLAVLAFSYYKITLDLKASEQHVHETKILNAELVEKNRQLEMTNEELDSFNYISSHDLQEPVRKIRTFISMIQESDYDKLSEKNKYNFHRIEAASVRIQELLQDLLTYSQLNRKPLDFVEVDLNQVIKKVKEKLSETIAENKAVIQSDRLPVLNAVRFQMEQLFEHLLTNSLRYKQPETVPQIKIGYALVSKKEINSNTAIENSYHKICIRDNGLGFEQEQERKIFELFTQLHNKQLGGTGIGLTICKKIVHNHHGFIEAKSRVNEGAVFEIYLPA